MSGGYYPDLFDDLATDDPIQSAPRRVAEYGGVGRGGGALSLTIDDGARPMDGGLWDMHGGPAQGARAPAQGFAPGAWPAIAPDLSGLPAGVAAAAAREDQFRALPMKPFLSAGPAAQPVATAGSCVQHGVADPPTGPFKRKREGGSKAGAAKRLNGQAKAVAPAPGASASRLPDQVVDQTPAATVSVGAAGTVLTLDLRTQSWVHDERNAGWIPWNTTPLPAVTEHMARMPTRGRSSAQEKKTEQVGGTILRTAGWFITPETPFVVVEALITMVCKRLNRWSDMEKTQFCWCVGGSLLATYEARDAGGSTAELRFCVCSRENWPGGGRSNKVGNTCEQHCRGIQIDDGPLQGPAPPSHHASDADCCRQQSISTTAAPQRCSRSASGCAAAVSAALVFFYPFPHPSPNENA